MARVAAPSTTRQPQRTGILLVGHGTRSSQGTGEVLTLARLLAERASPTAVEPAFLEMSEPTIAAGLARLVERGVEQVIVVPLLLFAAGHAKQDIPQAVKAGLAEIGADRVTVNQAEPFDCQPPIVELSSLRFTEALQGRSPIAQHQTCLLLVGRGSRDALATAQMYEFARLRAQSTPTAETAVAFLAMAEPTVDQMLPRLAAKSYRRIVVQPHLLLHGELYDRLAARVQDCRKDCPQTEWIVTRYLAEGLEHHPVAQELLLRAIEKRMLPQGSVDRAGRIHVVASESDG